MHRMCVKHIGNVQRCAKKVLDDDNLGTIHLEFCQVMAG